MSFDRAFGINQGSDIALDLAIKGDAEAQDRLFAQCIPRLQKVVARVLYNAQDSEDALQEGLLSAHRHINQFRGDARFTTWVHTIVVNAAKSELRRRRSKPSFSSLDEPHFEHDGLCVADMVADPHSNLDEEYGQKEKYQILAKAIQGLPPMSQVIISLFNIEELEMKEVAAKVGLSISATKSQHFRAIRRIQKTVKHVRARNQTGHEKPNCKTRAKSVAAVAQRGRSREADYRHSRQRREHFQDLGLA